MKAIVYARYGSPAVLRLEEVERPEPGPDDVLIRVCAATVGATDPVFRQGKPLISRLFTGLLRPRHRVLGDVIAGEIVGIGSRVTSFEVGEQVFGSTDASFGAHAEYACLPADGVLARIPDGVTHADAVAVTGGALTALPFLRDTAKIRPGQRVLINGASGSVGSSAVEIAKLYGADVTGVCSTANLELVRSLGADRVIDYTTEDFTRGGKRYDVVFDAVGKSSFSRSKWVLNTGGVYLTTVLGPAIVLQMLWTSRFGSKRARIALTGLRSTSAKWNDLLFIRKLMEAGQLRPVVDRKYPLEQAAEAHRYVETGHKKGSVILTVGQAAA